ncbi:MAG: PIN domain-containing protein [Methanophagales archaeon]|nr:PIN domain-containing protein [Methanophagales archaeon]
MLDKIESGTRVFIDANIFLYETFDHWRYGRLCKNFLDDVNKGKCRGITTVLVCNEIFHRVMLAEVVEKYEIEPKSAVRHLKKNWGIITELRKTWDVMLNIRQIENLKILEVTEEDFEVALSYSKKYGLLSNDAIHVATMTQHGITNIATNDPDFERVEGLTVWKP